MIQPRQECAVLALVVLGRSPARCGSRPRAAEPIARSEAAVGSNSANAGTGLPRAHCAARPTNSATLILVTRVRLSWSIEPETIVIQPIARNPLQTILFAKVLGLSYAVIQLIARNPLQTVLFAKVLGLSYAVIQLIARNAVIQLLALLSLCQSALETCVEQRLEKIVASPWAAGYSPRVLRPFRQRAWIA